MTDSSAFDLGAAWLRRSQGDMKAFMAGLAERLESALPGHVTVDRARDGLFSSHSHVERITVVFEQWRYELVTHHGHPSGKRARVVHGVVLSAQDLPVAGWLTALSSDIQALGDQEGEANAVLHDFLMS